MKRYIKTALLSGFIVFASCEDALEKDPIGLLTQGKLDETPTLTIVENSVKNSYMPLANTLNLYGSWDWAGGLVFQNDYVLPNNCYLFSCYLVHLPFVFFRL